MDLLDLFAFALIGVCAITDLHSGRIYNTVTYPAILVGIAGNVVLPGATGWESSLQGFFIAAVLMGTFTVLGGMGGGDTKLLAAIGALKGYPFIADVLFYSFLVGGAFALVVAVRQARLVRTLHRVGQMLFGIAFLHMMPGQEPADEHSYKIPFGVAICLGTLWSQLLEIFTR